MAENKTKTVKSKTETVQAISGVENRVLHMLKKSEDSKIRQYRSKGYSRRALKMSGKLGMKDFKIQKLISSELLVGEEYAESLFQSLCDKGFFDKSKLGFYSLSPKALEAMALVLRKKGLWGPAVIKILHRDLASRGMTRELKTHQTPKRTKVISPIIGHF